MSVLIEAKALTKKYGKKLILDGVDFSVKSGEIVGLLGLNGQGKTTLVNLLLGLTVSDSGEVFRNIGIKQEVGVMLQETDVPERMKVYEWINMIRWFSDRPASLEYVLELSGLSAERRELCTSLSGGQKRRLQFGISLTNKPKLLVLDEPTVGMDVIARDLFWETLKKMVRTEEVSVILISHDLGEVEEVSQRIAILHNKRILVDASLDRLRRSYFAPARYEVSVQDAGINLADGLPQGMEVLADGYVSVKNDEEGNRAIKAMISKGLKPESVVWKMETLSEYFKREVVL